ncbi:hypothetical protein NF212_25370 (plasmid) [Parasalinivibrio latis]|uniref:hypothetical protein n=1 Tax=Parasalinivibrio latis TaxID=2952610 RepID=UPI0030DE7753
MNKLQKSVGWLGAVGAVGAVVLFFTQALPYVTGEDNLPDLLTKLGFMSNEPPKPCRHPAHGLEQYLNSKQESKISGFQKGGPSRADYCEAQRVAIQNSLTEKGKVTLQSAVTSHKTKFTPFKQDYYSHNCTFLVETKPLYNKQVSEHCNNQN